MQVFEQIYENKVWGDNYSEEYKGSSGEGSSIEFNQEYIEFLKNFLKDYKIKSVVDLGSGDFRCGPLIYNKYQGTYTGYDIYSKVTETNQKNYSNENRNFKTLDFCTCEADEIQNAQLYIIKDVLQHWPNKLITEFLSKIVQKRKFTYLLVTNCCSGKEEDIENIGAFRPISNQLNNFFPFEVLEYKTKKVFLISRFIYPRDFLILENDLKYTTNSLIIIGSVEPTTEEIEILKNNKEEIECVNLGQNNQNFNNKGKVIIGKNHHYFITNSNLGQNFAFFSYCINKYPFTKILYSLKT